MNCNLPNHSTAPEEFHSSDAVARFRSIHANLTLRAKMLHAMRSFFDRNGFLEVDTPIKIAAPAPEEYIDCIGVDQNEFLRPSPELEMKLLIAAGYDKIYQFGSCFRAGEHGWKHREEFTMLEYYAAGEDYNFLQQFTTDLIRDTAQQALGKTLLHFRKESLDLNLPPERITVREAFQRYGGISMEEANAQDTFDEIMVCKIEPQLGRGRLSYLCDYPANRASLAKLRADDPTVAERFELYAFGVELSNAYSELTNGEEQTERFHAAADFRRARGAKPYAEATDFLNTLRRGEFPDCTGNALGFDRLVMLFADAEELSDVKY